MFIKITKNQKGIEYVYLVEGYRNKHGKPKQRKVKTYGRLNDLLKKDPNIIANLKKRASETIKKDDDKVVHADFSKSILETSKTVNYGYFFIEKIYHQLGLNEYFQALNKTSNFKYDINQVVQLLTFTRIIKPASKIATYNYRDKYFYQFDSTINDIYRGLSVLSSNANEIQAIMHKNVKKHYGQNLKLVFYDLTNYYFEIEKEDQLRKKGVSKEHKPNPIVQMGLLIDHNKIPIAYNLFPGNIHDSQTLKPMIKKLKTKFDIKQVIVVSDKGVNSSKNFRYLTEQSDKYIVSQKIRGMKREFIDKVLKTNDFFYETSSFKVKEFIWTKQLKDKANTNLRQRVIVFWSQNFAQKERYRHEKLATEIEKFVSSWSQYNAMNKHRAKRYIKTMHQDKTTGEVTKLNPLNVFNEARFTRDAEIAGYYAIVTNDFKMPAEKVIASYHELWKIEESFKVIKSDLEGRPVFVRREDRINGHFLICFVALTMLRIIEHILGNKFSSSEIKTALATATCKEFANGAYSIEKQSSLIMKLEEIHKTFLHRANCKIETIRKFRRRLVYYEQN